MSNYGMYDKLMNPWLTVEEINDEAQESALDDRVKSLDLLPVGALLEEDLKTRNQWNLGAGTYGAFTHEVAHNVIRGVVAGAFFTKRCKINGHASVFGVEFTDLDDEAATELVRVGSNAVVSFVNCIFRRDPKSEANLVYMEDEDGVANSVAAKAVFIGCVFIKGGPTAINNPAGAPGATNVQAIGCVNATGNLVLGANITETGTVST